MKKNQVKGEVETSTDQIDPIVLRKSLTSRVIYWVLQGLTFGTMIASVVLYLVTDQGRETTFNQVFMCVFALIAMSLPLFLERKFRMYIPNYITIVLYFLIFFHFVLGEVYRAYDASKLFDKILHTTSGVIIALVSFSVISMLNSMQRTQIKLSPFFIVLFTFCFTMTSEYLWEIFEYLMDTFFNANMQRWQDSLILAEGAPIPSVNGEGSFLLNDPRGNGLKDSMGDMMVNILGCVAVCIYAYIGMKLKPHWFRNRVMLTQKDIESLSEKGAVIMDENVAEVINRETKKDIKKRDDEAADDKEDLESESNDGDVDEKCEREDVTESDGEAEPLN